jgi:hypothetical protein
MELLGERYLARTAPVNRDGGTVRLSRLGMRAV